MMRRASEEQRRLPTGQARRRIKLSALAPKGDAVVHRSEKGKVK